jgi:hypothetical protein
MINDIATITLDLFATMIPIIGLLIPLFFALILLGILLKILSFFSDVVLSDPPENKKMKMLQKDRFVPARFYNQDDPPDINEASDYLIVDPQKWDYIKNAANSENIWDRARKNIIVKDSSEKRKSSKKNDSQKKQEATQLQLIDSQRKQEATQQPQLDTQKQQEATQQPRSAAVKPRIETLLPRDYSINRMEQISGSKD